jgi:hypothetical protein
MKYLSRTTERKNISNIRHYAVFGDGRPKYDVSGMRKAVLLAVLVLPCLLSGQQDLFIQTIEKVKLSIVPVACSSWPDNKGQVSVLEIEGTGIPPLSLLFPLLSFPQPGPASRRKSGRAAVSVLLHRLMGLFLGPQRERPGRCTPSREDC